MDYIKPDNIDFSFTRAGITASKSDDGLVDYTTENSSEGTILTDEVTVNGMRGIVDKLDNGKTLTLTVRKDTALFKKLSQMAMIRGQVVGFFKDESASEYAVNFTIISAGLQKYALQLSTNTSDFIIVGNFKDNTI